MKENHKTSQGHFLLSCQSIQNCKNYWAFTYLRTSESNKFRITLWNQTRFVIKLFQSLDSRLSRVDNELAVSTTWTDYHKTLKLETYVSISHTKWIITKRKTVWFWPARSVSNQLSKLFPELLNEYFFFYPQDFHL